MKSTFNITNISGMNVKCFKQELTHRGLLSHGLKPTLVERLQ